MRTLLSTPPLPAIVFIRLAVGCIFVSEGIQKFLFPAHLGVGRFTKIGISFPALTGPLVSVFEITGGFLILIGLFTCLAVIPLLLIRLLVITITKLIPLLAVGFWETAYGARTDFAMLLCTLFLLSVGGRKWSVDYTLINQETILPS